MMKSQGSASNLAFLILNRPDFAIIILWNKKPKRPSVFSRLLKLVLIAVVIFYTGRMFLLVFCFPETSACFIPVIRSAAEVDQLAQAAHMERWTNAAGQFIGLRRLATNQPAVGTVFMLYGNASTAVHCLRLCRRDPASRPAGFLRPRNIPDTRTARGCAHAWRAC